MMYDIIRSSQTSLCHKVSSPTSSFFFIVRALSHELRMAHFLKLLVKIALTVALDDAL